MEGKEVGLWWIGFLGRKNSLELWKIGVDLRITQTRASKVEHPRSPKGSNQNLQHVSAYIQSV